LQGAQAPVYFYENASAKRIGFERLTRELDRGAEAVASDAVGGGEGRGREGERERRREGRAAEKKTRQM
jgi:hypothetical protein